MKVVIAGCGTYGRVYLNYIRHCENFKIVGFSDDNEELIGNVIDGYPVLGHTNDYSVFRAHDIEGVIAPIGNNKARVRILKQAQKAGFATPNFIHPTAILHDNTKLGQGVYILPGSMIMPYVEIMNYVMISMGVNIAHHTILQEGVFLSMSSIVGAGVDVKKRAFIGIGSTIMTGVQSVGYDSLVGAGAVVIRDVSDSDTVAGVPAKSLKQSS